MELYVKKLAGRKLVMEYLSSVCLFKGGGGNAFNISIIWKHSFVETIINAMANGLLKTFAGSFISFGAILCISVYFSLSIFLTSCFTSQAETFRRWLLPAMRFFFSMFFTFIALILSILANDFQITSTAFLLSSISCSFAALLV